MSTTYPTTTIDLVGWGTFDDLSDSIPQRVFGELVKLAQPVLREFHSDLFWDAKAVTEIAGPTSFDYLVRPSGTTMGLFARDMFDVSGAGAVLYHVVLREEDRRWVLDVTIVGTK